MWSYIAGGVFLALAIYLIVQGIRCGIAVKESKDRLAAYNVRTAAYADTKRAVSRFPNCTFISFESGGHLLTGHGEEIKKAVSDFVENR